MASKMKHAKGERLNIRFNRKIKLEFHGARLTSDGGLLDYRELDEVLGLFNSASDVMNDRRTGRNIQHDLTNLLRQSVYSRLAGYEDVNDAQCLSVDPVMRAVTGKKKNATVSIQSGVSRQRFFYFASPSGNSYGQNDIYSSRLINGEYEEPKNLGNVINTTSIDHTPYIAPDENYLIYVSSRESSSPRDMKFYISYRNEAGSWMTPIDLGQKINSLRFALCPVVTPDGKYLFFVGAGDIYWVDAKIIEDLKPEELK